MILSMIKCSNRQGRIETGDSSFKIYNEAEYENGTIHKGDRGKLGFTISMLRVSVQPVLASFHCVCGRQSFTVRIHKMVPNGRHFRETGCKKNHLEQSGQRTESDFWDHY